MSLDEMRYTLLDRLGRIEAILNPPKIAKVVFIVTIGGLRVEASRMQLKVTSKLPMSLQLVDKFGNVAIVDGAPVWVLTNPALGSLVVAADGLSAELTPTGPLGSFAVQVAADADLGEGIKTISGELPIELLSGDAVTVQIVAGTPIPQA